MDAWLHPCITAANILQAFLLELTIPFYFGDTGACEDPAFGIEDHMLLATDNMAHTLSGNSLEMEEDFVSAFFLDTA